MEIKIYKMTSKELEDSYEMKLSDENRDLIEKKEHKINRHSNFLIIQMNALLKSLSAEFLKLDQNDFDKLWKNTQIKYNEIANGD